MKVVTDPTIQGMSGRFPKSRLVMNHREGKTITHARSYVRPDNVAQQDAFKAKLAAIVATYRLADSAFITDLENYSKQYNQQIVDDHELPVTKYALFVKACFAAADANSFDISTLTAANFGTGLLDGDSDTTYYLITNAGMPILGFVSTDLASELDVSG
ncbi:MAG: hypothetical protein DRI23_05625 [Candidatus Cloacimonadota bacterium]|nr:MAG: hypothetical protein DRH79_07030 [Candidatus Cloacimonadota bacterium]RLC51135.1 MAG: hypothetical protein DRI23_05625 [Candidatus Cloacimonadota bacterium]